MKNFYYVRPTTVREAVSAATEPGSAYLAAGTNLLDLMKGGVTKPDRLVDITHLLGLDRIEDLPDGSVRIGALVRNADLAHDRNFARRFPAVAEALLSGASSESSAAAVSHSRTRDWMAWIETLRIEGGVLDGFAQAFDRRLNVLIGGRGTGKSSVIQLIRFCLGATSYTEQGQKEATEHALGVLGDGLVTVTINDGKRRFDVSRSAQDTEPQADESFNPPFVFSQAEIESIGLQAQSRLRLVDDFLPTQQAGCFRVEDRGLKKRPHFNSLSAISRDATWLRGRR
jgi:hypothetical protein